MSTQKISKYIEPAGDSGNDRLSLTVKVPSKSLITPGFFAVFIFLPILIGVGMAIDPKSRFITAILAAVMIIAVVLRLKLSRYKKEDGLVVYKEHENIVLYKKSEMQYTLSRDLAPVTRAWLDQNYINGALSSSAIILFTPTKGNEEPRHDIFNEIDFTAESILDLPRMHPNIHVVDDINALVLDFIARNFHHIEIVYRDN